MQKVNLEELAGVAGGMNVGSAAEVGTDLAMKENQAAVCGMGTTRLAAGMGGAENTRTVKAYCSSCGKKTMFFINSGAQSTCSVCGYIRLDL